MTCTDVYILGQDTCDTGVMYVYPPQVHPHGGGVRPTGPLVRRVTGRGIDPRVVDLRDDDEVAIAIALLDLT